MNYAIHCSRSGRGLRLAALVLTLFCLALPGVAAAQSPPLTITTSSVPPATTGSFYSFTFQAAGGTPPYTWSGMRNTPDNAANDLTVSAAGVLSGTPGFSGLTPLVVQVVDSAVPSATATVQFDFAVSGTGSPHTITNAPPAGTQGTLYAPFTFTVSWGACGTLRLIEGGIPAGLTVNSATRTISGTPLVAGEFTFTLAADAGTTACSRTLPIYTNARTFTMTISPSGAVSTPPGGSGWTRDVAASGFLFAGAGGWEERVSSPSVVKMDPGYRMFYEGEDAATHRRAIGMASSVDGVTWTKSASNPVFPAGPAGSWDAADVRYPTVHFDGVTLRMWYWGANADGCNRIGLATSTDRGETWTRRDAPVLGTCAANQNLAPGSVVLNSGFFDMYYWVPSNASFGRARSADGITWIDLGALTFDVPITAAGGANSLSRPVVVRDGATFRMWFNIHRGFVAGGVSASDVYREHIGYATSANGQTWDVLDEPGATPPARTMARTFGPGAAGAWDRPAVGQPWVIKDGTTWRMWYTGGRIELPRPDVYSFMDGSMGLASTPGVATPPTLSAGPPSTNFGNVAVGASIERTLTVANVGDGTLEGTATTSTPFGIVSGGTFSLAAGQSQPVVVRFAAAAVGTPTGTLGITSNGGSASLTLTAAAVSPADLDLQVTGVSMPPTGAAGFQIAVTSTVRNLSPTRSSPTSQAGIFLSVDRIRDVGDVQMGSRPVPALPPLGVSTMTVNVTIPPTTPETTPADPSTSFFVIVEANSGVPESAANSANNQGVSATKITITRPDLTVTAVTAPAVATVGQSIPVAHTVRNAGRSAVPPRPDGRVPHASIFLSTTANPPVAATMPLLGTRPIPLLAAGAVSAATTNVRIPSGTSPGSYFIVVRPNSDNVVSEGNDQNNQRATPIIIGPDLVVSGLTTAPAALVRPGQTVSVVNTVRNQGAPTTQTSTAGIYLSTANTLAGGTFVSLGTRGIPVLAAGAVSSATTLVPVPEGTAPGMYFIIVKADDTNVIVEASETNNERATAVLTVGPDLLVSALALQAPVAAVGQSMVITSTVMNRGVAAATPSTEQIYLSTASTLGGGGTNVRLATRTIPALPANGLSTGGTTVRIPSDTAPGQYFIIANADDTLAITEADETNNERALPITVGPDLAVTAVIAAPATVAGIGQSIVVTSTVRNLGSASPASAAQIYLSTASTFAGGTNVPLGTPRTIPALAGAIGLSTAPITVRIPTDTAPGQYFIIVRVDEANAITEASETNNERATAAITVGPDLVVSALTVPTSVVGVGQSVMVTRTVRNQGGVTPLTSTERIYLCTANTLAGGTSVPLGTRTIPGLGVNGLSTAVLPVTIPIDTAPGVYFIIAKANEDAALPETNVANNERATAAITVVRPDLVVSALTVPMPIAGIGQPVVVTNTVRNQGTVMAPASTARIYLSTANTLAGATPVSLATRVVPALGAGAVSTAATTVTIPPGTAPGVYFIIAMADDGLAIPETNETNNERATVAITVGPDLMVSALTVPTSIVGVGQSIMVTNAVTNQGSGTALASTVRIYLSTANTLVGATPVSIGSRVINGLGGTATSVVATPVTIPLGTAPGVYFIIARADDGSAVTEARETNNERATAAIRVGPDLTVSAVTTPATVARGASLAVSSTVMNLGGPTTQATTASIFLSTNNTLSGDDVQLGTRAVPVLAMNGASATVNSVVIPAGTAPGAYFVLVVADNAGAIAEINETNNLRARATPITVN